ncbi:MAG: alpha-amylase/4-alpha-glucanotransferase domain-containing protein, partial [Candidatus Saccharicenans sp.]
RIQLGLRKRIRAGRKALLFVYEIENLEDKALDLTFTSEWNLAFFEQEFRLEGRRVEFYRGQLLLEAPEAEAIWVFPLKTVSQSERDFEVITQGHSFHFVWRLSLAGREKKLTFLTLRERD